jgi:hypothetical protein
MKASENLSQTALMFIPFLATTKKHSSVLPASCCHDVTASFPFHSLSLCICSDSTDSAAPTACSAVQDEHWIDQTT